MMFYVPPSHSTRRTRMAYEVPVIGCVEQLLLSRNWGLISPEVQARLRDQVILAAGVGLRSEMVVQACRLGFRNFILADGDTVEVSNLNRQAFTHAQVG